MEDTGANDAHGLTASALFDLLWGSLADVLGTAASAVLLRRDAERGAEIEEEVILGLALAAAREVPPGDECRDIHEAADIARSRATVAEDVARP